MVTLDGMAPLALITGAGGDIGRRTACALVDEGVDVVLAEHPHAAESLAETADACESRQATVDVRRMTFDVTDESRVDDAIDGTMPDLLFNNAGCQGEFATVDRYPADDFRHVIEVNLVGAFNVLRAVTSRLRSSGREGAVVNVASMAGVAGPPNMTAYSASKAAVIGLTKSAAKDLAPHGIRVNAISPGFIGEGAMWRRQIERQAAADSPYYSDSPRLVAEEMVGQIPLGRPGTLAEVASAAVFLLSPEASYLTGVNLEIAGGAQ